MFVFIFISPSLAFFGDQSILNKKKTIGIAEHVGFLV